MSDHVGTLCIKGLTELYILVLSLVSIQVQQAYVSYDLALPWYNKSSETFWIPKVSIKKPACNQGDVNLAFILKFCLDENFGLFLPNNKNKKKSQWLLNSRNLDFYDIENEVFLFVNMIKILLFFSLVLPLPQLHYSKNISLNKKVAIYKNIILVEKYRLCMYQLYYCICTYLICICTYSCKWEISSGFFAVMIFQRRCHPDRLQRFKVMLRKTSKNKLCDSIRVMHQQQFFMGNCEFLKELLLRNTSAKLLQYIALLQTSNIRNIIIR